MLWYKIDRITFLTFWKRLWRPLERTVHKCSVKSVLECVLLIKLQIFTACNFNQEDYSTRFLPEFQSFFLTEHFLINGSELFSWLNFWLKVDLILKIDTTSSVFQRYNDVMLNTLHVIPARPSQHPIRSNPRYEWSITAS